MSVNIEKLCLKNQHLFIFSLGTKLSTLITKKFPLKETQVKFACYALALLIHAEIFVVRIFSPFRFMLNLFKKTKPKFVSPSNAQFAISPVREDLEQQNKVVYISRYHG